MDEGKAESTSQDRKEVQSKFEIELEEALLSPVATLEEVIRREFWRVLIKETFGIPNEKRIKELKAGI